MNFLRKSISRCHLKVLFDKQPPSLSISRFFCDNTERIPLEKSVNHVTLLGRVGVDPQVRGSENKPVVVFTVATNINYRYETGELQQKTDWHRISVFKPYLRDVVITHLKKGSRVYIDGRIMYGEFSDSSGVTHATTTIVANDIVFLGLPNRKAEAVLDDAEEYVNSVK